MPAVVRTVTDERDALIAFLDQQRDAFRNVAYGLTDDQLRIAPLASSEMTIGGLLKHVATCEREWMQMIAVAPQPVREVTSDENNWGSDWILTAQDTADSLIAAVEANAERSREILLAADLDAFVPAPPAPWFEVDGWSARWVVFHLIEELARHAGHGDVLREAIDGATMYELIAGRENWPADGYITPWQPARLQPAASGPGLTAR